jgi:precorrin-6B methylase 1
MSPTSEIDRCAYIVGLERVLSIFPSVARAVARHWAESEERVSPI